MELKPATKYVSLFPKGAQSKKLLEGKEVLSELSTIKNLLTEAKRKKKKQEEEQELFGTEPAVATDPYEDCVKQVNVLITNLITKFGTNNPAVDILIDASRDLEEIKNSEQSEGEEEESQDED